MNTLPCALAPGTDGGTLAALPAGPRAVSAPPGLHGLVTLGIRLALTAQRRAADLLGTPPPRLAMVSLVSI